MIWLILTLFSFSSSLSPKIKCFYQETSAEGVDFKVWDRYVLALGIYY